MTILKRWLDVLLVIAFACGIILLLFKPILTPLSEWLNQTTVILRLLYIFFSSLLLWFFIKSMGGNTAKFSFKYPSVWFISIVSFLLCFATVLLWDERMCWGLLVKPLTNLFVFFLGLPAIWFFFWMSEQKSNDKGKKQIGHLLTKNPKGLYDAEDVVKWSQSELPIADSSSDLFNHRYIAEKVTGILNDSVNKNVAIVGDFGSGKSSIINLIKSQRTKRDIYCTIEGWGFKEHTAVEHILELIIEELKNHIDCLSISSLPQQYQKAMFNSGNSIFSALDFATGTRNPEKILRKIDNMFKCVNKNLIIILEDIDRNINDATFYNEIASFLNVTKKLDRISFIIAVGQRNKLEPVLTKLCEHSGYVQRIDKYETIKILNSLISYFHSHPISS